MEMKKKKSYMRSTENSDGKTDWLARPGGICHGDILDFDKSDCTARVTALQE